jgi:hypothetical protein
MRLRGLSMHLGRTSDLRLLPRFPELEEINLLRITGLSDLSMLAELTAPKALTLDWLRNLTSLLSLAPLQHLETVSMETIRGLTSLASIAAAPALQRLEIITMPQLKPADFACLVGHPSLRVLRAYPGGKRSTTRSSACFQASRCSATRKRVRIGLFCGGAKASGD